MDWKKVIGGVGLAVLAYIINRPYITLTFGLTGFVLFDKENMGLNDITFFWAYFIVLFLLYNLKLYGVIG